MELALWILDRRGEAFFLQEAQDAMREHGEASSGVAKELRNFVDCGMLQEMPDQNRVYFTPVSSSYWDAFRAIGKALGATARRTATGSGGRKGA